MCLPAKSSSTRLDGVDKYLSLCTNLEFNTKFTQYFKKIQAIFVRATGTLAGREWFYFLLQ